MKLAHLALTLAAASWCSLAMAQPAMIPRMALAPHDSRQTFNMLKQYFSDTSLNLFQLVRADEATKTIVAKRAGIDSQTWNQWTYCSLGPEHLLDTLRDGSVTLNLKIEGSGAKSSYVTVTADFEGTYGLGSSVSTTQCISNGVLENSVLTAVGASPSGT
jgi:hypothetical protein